MTSKRAVGAIVVTTMLSLAAVTPVHAYNGCSITGAVFNDQAASCSYVANGPGVFHAQAIDWCVKVFRTTESERLLMEAYCGGPIVGRLHTQPGDEVIATMYPTQACAILGPRYCNVGTVSAEDTNLLTVA